MNSVSLLDDVSRAGWTIVLCLLSTVIAVLLGLRPIVTRSKTATSSLGVQSGRSTRSTQGVHLSHVNPDKTEIDTDIDIVAIHGLDTESPHTWTWKTTGVNWLQDPAMLPREAETARIFTCDWPADLFSPSDLIQKRIEEYARLLLDGIQQQLLTTNNAGREDRPIFFIASCLGGIILMKALVEADDAKSSYYRLRKATRGIVFLATPFRGTSFQNVAAWAEPGMMAWASVRGREVSTLLDSVKGSTFDLEELVGKFTRLCQDKSLPCHIFNFYELGKTSLPSKVVPWLPTRFRQEKPV
jgi:hypothetical protein